MPMLSANSAAAPRVTSPVWAIAASAPTSGGATHVVTISAVKAPMTAVPMNVPALCLLARLASRVCTAVGICSSNTPNMPSDNKTNSPANSEMIQGF